MKKEINDLISRYFGLGLITTALVPVKGQSAQQSLVYKEVKMRTSKAWDIKEPTTQEYSDKLAMEMIQSEKMLIANELFELTKAIVLVEGVAEQKVYGDIVYYGTKDEVMYGRGTTHVGHLEKMMWCIVRLRALKVISPFIRQYLQPVLDNNGNLIGNKIVPEDQLDNVDQEEEEENHEV